MYQLFHIYGPIYVHSFGLMIALGLLVFSLLVQRDPRFMSVTRGFFNSALLLGIFVGVFGGRALYVATSYSTIEHWSEIVSPLVPGFSMLGSVLGVLFIVPLYLKFNAIPVLPFFDLVTLYAPALHAICRIGCFLAGCCYGKITSVPWSVIYTTENTVAPTCIPMHPTQLYSVAANFFIFFLMYFLLKKYLRKPGQTFMVYLMLTSLERFVVDFFRGDREFFDYKVLHLLSIHQWIALVTISVACLLLMLFSVKSRVNFETKNQES